LIHIGQQWAENRVTMEGKVRHENADNPFFTGIKLFSISSIFS
jgi:hypothetical protein